MEVHLVADTNLFFEFKSLEQLPWVELGYDSVVILLTKPVLDEIDKHKKANGRTRARALEIFGRVRGMLKSSLQEVEIQQSSPRVVLRLRPKVKPDAALEEELDYTKPDERLVGIVSTLNAEASSHTVKLFTDDTGPAATADGLGVPYLMIDESWRRPPSETTEEKRIKELERDLSTYRAQEPKVSISACQTTDESNVVEVTTKVATPLTKLEVEEVLVALRRKHPLVTDFTAPRSSSTTDPFGMVTTIEYASPTEEDIANYRDVLYPQWLEQCCGILKNLHEGRDEVEPRVVLHWLMSNKGTRPASQVRIEFEAHGPLALRRLPIDAEDGEVVEVDTTSSQSPPARFPPAPRPLFRKQVSSISSQDEKYAHIARLSKAAALGLRYPFLQLPKGMNPDAVAAAASQVRPSLSGIYGLDAFLKSSGPTISEQLIEASRYNIQKPRDPETFYYDWPVNQQVKKVL